MAVSKVIVTDTTVKVVTLGTQGLPINLAQFAPNNLLGIKQVGVENVLAEYNQADILTLLYLETASSDISILKTDVTALQGVTVPNAEDNFFFEQF